jgi:hypothetical protein
MKKPKAMKATSLAALLAFLAWNWPILTEAATPGDKTRALTPEERAEKEARKDCEIKICGILATKEAQGESVSCEIVNTWCEEDIVNTLGGINWPWARRSARLNSSSRANHSPRR